MKPNTTFGLRLRALREHAGLSRAQLGQAAGVHPVTIANIELGKYAPLLETMAALADALGVSLGEFDPEAKPQKKPEKTKRR